MVLYFSTKKTTNLRLLALSLVYDVPFLAHRETRSESEREREREREKERKREKRERECVCERESH